MQVGKHPKQTQGWTSAQCSNGKIKCLIDKIGGESSLLFEDT